MLTEYVRAAMKKAKYEILLDDNTFYGDIPGFDGIYANADTLEGCREELEEVLEEWLFFRISRNLPLPIVGGIELMPKKLVDKSQAYFWTKRWQEGEREADADIVAGRVKTFDSVEDLIEDLG